MRQVSVASYLMFLPHQIRRNIEITRDMDSNDQAAPIA